MISTWVVAWMGRSGGGGGGNWILQTGVWDDTGVWNDTSNWID